MLHVAFVSRRAVWKKNDLSSRMYFCANLWTNRTKTSVTQTDLFGLCNIFLSDL